VSTGLLQLGAGLLIGAGLFFLGLYVGLGIREDREAERHARIALARAEARGAAGATVYLLAPPPDRPRMPTGRANYHPADYLAPPALPRAGRLAVDLGQLADDDEGQAPELSHGPASRPTTSLVDLDGAVRLMCIETEQYVAGLIAQSCHAERGHPW
jgi:hypothetical protein